MKALTIALSGILSFLWLVGCNQVNNPALPGKAKTIAQLDSAALIKRGDYLVTVLVCDDCHTPKKMTPNGPEPDLTRRLSEHPANEIFQSDDVKNKLIKDEQVAVFSAGLTAIAGPWGVSYAANLTPDETGTGIYPAA